MLALASPDVSGRKTRVAEGAGEQSALPRPAGLPHVEFMVDGLILGITTAYHLSRGWQDLWYMRYVYWTGYEVMYGQWAWYGIEYPIVGTRHAL